MVGRTDGMLVRRYYEESDLGNLFADIARESTGADIGLMPSGALRRDLPQGAVRREELIDAFPFEDRLARVTVSGDVLLAILEQGFSLERGLLQVAGMRVYYDAAAAPGARVHAVCIGGQPLAPARRYSVGTVEILARGGDAYHQFAAADDSRLLAESFADVLEAFFRARSPIAAPRRGRLLPVAPPAAGCLAQASG